MSPDTRHKQNNILVLDGEEFSTLAIVRSLGRQGLNVTVAATNKKAISRYSKYTHNFFTYPDPLVDVEGFYQCIKEHLSKTRYKLLIPVTELTSIPLSRIREQIEQQTVLAIAANDALEFVTDKVKTFALAQSLDIPIPKSYNIIESTSLEDCINHIHFPVVIKPSRSIADPDDDIRAKLKVDYAFNPDELQKKVIHLLKYSEIILQEYCNGTGTGIELIADHGTIIHAFQHQRLHELPLTGGGSCLRKSVAINPQLLDYSKKLIKALKWHGVAMVEFKHNAKTDQNYLMEINGRFWGSLPLAVFSGSDFPWFLYLLLIKQQHPEKFNSSTGHISRKMEQDLYWYIQVIFRRDGNPLIKWPSTLQIFKDFISIFHYKHHFDAFYYKDLKPGFIELSRTSAWLFSFSSNFILKKYLHRKHLKIKQNNSIKHPLQYTKKILFLCYGNINRSAAAECILQQQGNKKNLTIESAGFHSKDKRPADPNMVKVAQQYHVDMQNCTSNTVNETMIHAAELIFVMEIEHMIRLVNLYPQAKSKTFLLGSLSTDEKIPLEISDPYGRSVEAYEDCFKQIKNCVNAI